MNIFAIQNILICVDLKFTKSKLKSSKKNLIILKYISLHKLIKKPHSLVSFPPILSIISFCVSVVANKSILYSIVLVIKSYSIPSAGKLINMQRSIFRKFTSYSAHNSGKDINNEELFIFGLHFS